MALSFGTSGVRGLVSELTDRECYRYGVAFRRFLGAQPCAVGGDLRASTERIMVALAAGLHAGEPVHHLGRVPSPAVALYGLARQCGSAMVTGSHIPDDRNGIKFNLASGEIAKADEQAITALYEQVQAAGVGAEHFDAAGAWRTPPPPLPPASEAAALAYVQRYYDSFPAGCLAGLRLVVYQHSAVARELLVELLLNLGASVIPVGWAEQFVPVDTEAVTNPEQLAAWVAQHRADALVSTDGDSDRPLLVDATGTQVRGDVLGILVARELGADWVATPVSCNTALERCGSFATVRRTRIGSPYVIAGLAEGLAAGARTVVGYEANGGFLTATPVRIPGGGVLAPLPTRDALLPLLAALHGARRRGQSLAAWRAELPARFTWSGLLRETPAALSQRLMAELRAAPSAAVAARFRPHFGELAASDFTDGARYTFADGTVVHLRPSGNAPEFRCYTEADSEAAARAANDRMLALLRGDWLPRLAAPGAP